MTPAKTKSAPKENKLKDLNIRIGEKERQRFIDKCNYITQNFFTITHSNMIREWIDSWTEHGVPVSEYGGDYKFEYESFDYVGEAKNKVLNIRISEVKRKAFINKCSSHKPVGIDYGPLIRMWINNWVERGDPNKDS